MHTVSLLPLGGVQMICLNTASGELLAVWGLCARPREHIGTSGLDPTQAEIVFKWNFHLGLRLGREVGGVRPQELQLWQQLLEWKIIPIL